MTDQTSNKTTKKNETGSPVMGEPLSIAVGRIRRPHGVVGEVIFEPYPEYSIKLKKGIVLQIGRKKEVYTVFSVRKMDRNYLIAFEGFNDCDVVSHLRNQIVYLKESELKHRDNGGSYPHEVLGMKVIDESGKVIGELREVMLTGANDVYVIITPDEKEVLIPAIDSVVIKIDPQTKIMTIRPPIWE
jgi:16S rRNA processing protein RimM